MLKTLRERTFRLGRMILLFSAMALYVGSIFCLLLVGGRAEAKSLKVIVLTDAAGLGDKGFNDVCWRGVQEAKKAFQLHAQFLQAREQADYVPNLSLAAKHADIVVSLGFLYVDAVQKVAPHFPDTRFIHIEGDIKSDNVACFDFKSEEGGFLAGLVAGLFTKTKKVGMVTGMDIPPVEAYVCGFRVGVETAEKTRDTSVETIIVSAGSFNDPVKGKSLAQALIQQGVDVIFRAAGNTGIGVFEAVKQSEGVYLIAEDLNQDSELPGRILTSTLKRMDVAVYNAIKSVVEGQFQPGHQWLGAAQGAMGITDMKYSRDLFSKEDFSKIQHARELLKSGRLSIPSRYADVDRFEPPEL